MSQSNSDIQHQKDNSPDVNKDNSLSTVLNLSEVSQIDLTGLSQEQINALKFKQAEGMIDLQKKKEEIRIDVCALDASLSSFNVQTDKATKDGHSATIQHSQNSSLGRTEVIIGNTEKAATGKLSLSASGESGNLIKIILIIATALVLISFFAGK